MLDHAVSYPEGLPVLTVEPGLRGRIESILYDALHDETSSAAREFADLIGPYVSLAFFMASSRDGVPDEAILMGPDIGTVFISSDVVKARLAEKRVTLSFRTAFAPGGGEFAIEAARETNSTNRDVPNVISAFLATLADEFYARDVLISRAEPMTLSHHESPSQHASTDAVPRRRRPNPALVLGALMLVLALVALVIGHGKRHSHNLASGVSELEQPAMTVRPGEAQIQDTHIPALAPVQQTAAIQPSTQGIGGVTVKVGGYGVGSGPKLQAFGIQPGAELAGANK
jgi:hypothetical protein